ncbi:unnamed protein product [Rangifer tarandus platyrhynchus]|uniref:Uncharacterized protein n=1 Tax=Rangifer tarandus platyrhynchus TaxID=3082113 RepID=A0AC60A2P0_RANTA
MPRAPGGYRQSQSGAQCVRQAALRSPAERAGDPEPWPARATQASAVVFPVLFLYPRGVGPGVQGPSPSRGAPTTIIKALTGHFVIVK